MSAKRGRPATSASVMPWTAVASAGMGRMRREGSRHEIGQGQAPAKPAKGSHGAVDHLLWVLRVPPGSSFHERWAGAAFETGGARRGAVLGAPGEEACETGLDLVK